MYSARIYAAILAAALLGACSSTADLALRDLALSTTIASPGAAIQVDSTIENRGGAEARARDGAPAAPSVDIQLYRDEGDNAAVAPLSQWSVSSDWPLRPGEKESNRTTILAPTRVSPGAYFVCGDADLMNEIPESNERNNRLCAPLTLLGGPTTRADLMVESVKFVGRELASAKIVVKVKNAGEAPAAPFAVMAFSRNPRRPLLLTACALTEAQRVSGSIPTCGGLWTNSPLPTGGSVEWTGYVTALFQGSTMPTTPIGPTPKPKIVKRTIDIMADGCFAPTDSSPSPSWCRVDEIDEINNFGQTVIEVSQ